MTTYYFFFSLSLFFSPPPCNTRPSNKDVLPVQIVLGGVLRVKIGFLTARIALRSAIQVMAAGACADCVLTSPIVQDQDTFCYPPEGTTLLHSQQSTSARQQTESE